MDTERVLAVGERGIHLLFDTAMITQAFGQDADVLRRALAGRFDEVHFAVQELSRLPSVEEGRRFVADLSETVRHVVVLLYFELLDGRLRRHPTLH